MNRPKKPKTNPSDLRVTRLPLAELTPYLKNPRHITPAAINAVAESLAAFGWQQPIVIDPKRVIVAGHTRRLAALQLGWTHGPTVTIAAKHARAYRLADNRSGEFSTWDLDVLPGELEALPTGQLEALPALDFGAIVQPSPVEGQTNPDDIPEAPEPRTKRGDVWTLCDHRLMCGDATEAACLQNLMDGRKAGLLFTSPPYLNQRAYKTGVDDWDVLMRGVFSHCHMTDSGQILVNLGIVHRDHEWLPYWDGWIEWMREQGWRRFGLYVWDKGAAMPGKQQGRLGNSFEFVFHFNRVTTGPNKTVRSLSAGQVSHRAGARPGGQRAFDGTIKSWSQPDRQVQSLRVPDNVIRVHRRDLGVPDHPAIFPVALPGFFLTAYTDTGGIVYDPFVGSGTTIIAAEREKRRCYAMEIAPEYCDVAVARWEAFTGRTAKR